MRNSNNDLFAIQLALAFATLGTTTTATKATAANKKTVPSLTVLEQSKKKKTGRLLLSIKCLDLSVSNSTL